MWRRKKTIVIDLDETLVHTLETPITHDMRNYLIPHRGYELAKCSIRGMWGIYRPYTREFLKYCHKTFDRIIIWSAGTEEYVHCIVEALQESFDFYPDEIYSRPDCVFNNYMKYYHKPLKKLNVDMEATLIIDDKKHTFQDNCLNGILVPEWAPSSIRESVSSNDKCLLEFMLWLNQNVDAEDIRYTDKNIFNVI